MNSEEEQRAQPDYIHPRPAPERQGLSSGFWLPDEDPQEIIASDEATMAELGIEPEQLARKMAWVVELSRRDEHYCKTFTHDRFTISSAYYRMYEPCPLCTGGGGNGELTVIDNVTQEGLYFPSMMPHLVFAHHFFESPSSSYRVEPEEAERVLRPLAVPDDFHYDPRTRD
jgi:hypothetical protein